jgi:hypothetical protein
VRHHLHWLAAVPLALAIAWPAPAQQPMAAVCAPWMSALPPEVVCRVAAADLERLPPQDRPFTRYLSWHGVPPAKRGNWQTLMNWWVQQLSTGPTYYPLRQVSPFLQAVDLRDYRWNRAAWSAVAQRDVLFREPLVDTLTADRLRQLTGVEQDPKTLAVDTVVWAPRLFRDSIETNRTSTYYDLLFAEQRFKGGKAGAAKREPYEVEEIVDHKGGDYTGPDGLVRKNLAPGRYSFKVTKYREVAGTGEAAAFVDFPKDEDDWNEFFGVKASVDYLHKQRIDIQNGAVVAGSSDDPVRGSIVARNNRVVVITPVLRQGGNAVATETFDVLRTSGKKDFSERHTEIVVGDIQRDAGELLAPLFNGGQAGLLVNAQGKRIEKADIDVAHNRKDPVYGDVRTMMGCVGCHQPDEGFIMPKDLTREMLLKGVDVYTKDRDLRNRMQAFFLEWDTNVAGWRAPYAALRAKATRNPANPADKGWTPAKLDLEFHALRNWYDGPVSAEQAGAEVGVPHPFLRVMVSRSQRARLGLLAQGVAAPRNVWDDDLVPEVSARIAAVRDNKPEYNEKGR